MTNTRQNRNQVFGISPCAATTALALTIVLCLAVFVAKSAQAQTYTVIHTFTGGLDGTSPYAGLTMDRGGNLYGTAYSGGIGQGTVFKLKHSGSSWIFTPLYEFQGGNDGAYPEARVIFGPDGSLYGTTSGGGAGGSGCCGTVFNLKPPPTACMVALCDWTETVLYRFKGGTDGNGPNEVVFDPEGSLYGTTVAGGAGNCQTGCGVVFKLTPSSGSWTEKVLYQFSGGADGATPFAPVILDKAGSLYGTTYAGGNLACEAGYGCGAVFQLTPSGAGWLENTLYSFQEESDGAFPYAGLTFDQSGNLYGAVSDGGASGGGTAFELMPSGGSWTEALLYSFTGIPGQQGGPHASLVMDKGGDIYGTTEWDGAYGYGAVFKLTFSGGDWTYTALHDFAGGNDGAFPTGGVLLDANGNLYGTAVGGAYGEAVVWEITP